MTLTGIVKESKVCQLSQLRGLAINEGLVQLFSCPGFFALSKYDGSCGEAVKTQQKS